MSQSRPSDRELAKKLGEARMRLLKRTPFLTILLLQMRYGLEDSCGTVYTDAEKIVFDPDFLNQLSPIETEFVLLHEVLHVALQHCFRRGTRDEQLFQLACDIVVNGTILEETGLTLPAQSILGLKAISQTPDGQSGANFSVEEVYAMLKPLKQQKQNSQNSSSPTDSNDNGEDNDDSNDGDNDKDNNKDNDKNNDKDNDNDNNKDNDNDSNSDKDKDNNSNGKNKCKGKGKSKSKKNKGKSGKSSKNQYDAEDLSREDLFHDDHSHWPGQSGSTAENEKLANTWNDRLLQTAISIEQRGFGRGTTSLMAQRILNKLRKPKLNWRTLLYNFIHYEINDYTFTQPDRRFQDSNFLLPGFYETRERTNIFVAIDASGSISDQQLTDAVSEILSAIQSFQESVWVSFFDTFLSTPKRYTTPKAKIEPVGGGGTDFTCIFDYLAKPNKVVEPHCIIILTDGLAPFPHPKMALGIPVLWILDNDDITPPWGKVVRLPSAKKEQTLFPL